MKTVIRSEIVTLPCWRLSPVDLCDFLRNAHRIAPESAVFRLASGGVEDIEDFMATRAAIYPNEPEERSLFVFKTPKIFYMPATKMNLEGLATLCDHHAEAEVGIELEI